MIYSNQGSSRTEGNTEEILQDFQNVSGIVYRELKKKVGPSKAKRMMIQAVKKEIHLDQWGRV